MTGRPRNSPEKVWDRIEVRGEDECWPWLGSTKNGYGRFWFDWADQYAHRFVCELVKGPVPTELDVMHSCNNKLCCNPKHLMPGTAAQNTQDAYRDGLAPSGEQSTSSKLTAAQVEAIRADQRRQVEIAAHYDISQTQVSRIKCGLSWRYI